MCAEFCLNAKQWNSSRWKSLKPMKVRQTIYTTASYRKLTEDMNQLVNQVLRLTFQLNPEESYLPAQNIAVYPRNTPSKVQRILKFLKADPMAMYVPKSKAANRFPGRVNLKTLFLNFLDLNGPIKVSTLKKLASFDMTLNQSHNFQNLLKNKNIRNQYVKSNKNIIDLVEEFKMVLNVDQFIMACSTIKVDTKIL
jgi:sulfite reductase alpha subunit-like flavoprotein